MTPVQHRRERMQALVRGRLCVAIDALATIAKGQHLSHTLPTPEDVLRAFRSEKL